MYRKIQIETVESSIIYLRYVVDITSDVQVWVADPITLEYRYQLQRVNSISTALQPTQFVVDEDTNSILLNLQMKGQKIVIIYYTEGLINPFYASSNLHTFISKVLKWTANRIIDGLYVYWDYKTCNDSPIKHIKEGSFVYNGLYHIYQGGTFDIRQWAPPTTVGTYRGYRIFINDEIIVNHLNKQTNMLQEIGILTSDSTHNAVDAARLDVMNKYKRLYKSEPLDICYMYVLLDQGNQYEFWFEYPSDQRTL